MCAWQRHHSAPLLAVVTSHGSLIPAEPPGIIRAGCITAMLAHAGNGRDARATGDLCIYKVGATEAECIVKVAVTTGAIKNSRAVARRNFSRCDVPLFAITGSITSILVFLSSMIFWGCCVGGI